METTKQNTTKKGSAPMLDPQLRSLRSWRWVNKGSPPDRTPAAGSPTDLPSDSFIVAVRELRKPPLELNRSRSPCKSHYLPF